MDPTQENEALAAKIVDFFRTEFATEIVIEPVRPGEWRGKETGFEIATDAGASFTFEIFGETKAAAARTYFEHIRSVYKFIVDHRRSGSWLDGGRKYSRQEKEWARRHLAVLDAWARQHLPA